MNRIVERGADVHIGFAFRFFTDVHSPWGLRPRRRCGSHGGPFGTMRPFQHPTHTCRGVFPCGSIARIRTRAAASGLTAIVLLTPANCGPPDRIAPASVGRAWEQQEQAANQPAPVAADRLVGDATSGSEAPVAAASPLLLDPRPLATVDGRPIVRRHVVDLLLRSHGPGVLEQLIVLNAATRLAEASGVAVTQADVEREYAMALRRLTDPLATAAADLLEPTDHETAEQLLDSILSERNISREEFLITIRRNAFLRRLVQARQTFSEAQLRAEYGRSYGKRVRVRHIQLATPGAAARVQERLAAGEPFDDLARAHSVNQASAQEGGLLEPFSETDDRLPAPLREAAHALRPGEVSGAVRIGRWYHILKLEEVVPAQERVFSTARDDLTQRLRARLTGPAMRELYDKLFREASISIHDPVLRAAFEEKHPGRGR